MKPIMQTGFAVCLAVAVLAGGNARADEHAEVTLVGKSCGYKVVNDTFDGKYVVADCWDYSTYLSVAARCMLDTTEFYIRTDEYIMEDGIRLRIALDGVEIPEWDWNMATNNKALFIEPAIPTIKEVLKHSRLQVRVIERDGDSHNANIDISRLGEAIAPARELCGW